MKRLEKKALFWGTLFLFLFSMSPTKAYLQESSAKITELLPLTLIQKSCHPKMEHLLFRLMSRYSLGGIEGATKFAAQRKIDVSGNMVRLVVEAQPEGMIETEYFALVSSLKLQIENLRGRVEAIDGLFLQCLLPFDSIQLVVDLSTVRYLRFPIKMKHFVTSEGVSKTGANRWHSMAAYRSEAASVCILDLGFQGYESLLGNELPSSVITKSFRGDNDLSAGEVHGSACAEIVYDMAPEAKLFLVNFATTVELSNAVDWIIGQGADIISASFGNNYFPGNGTGPTCDAVKKAYDHGIVWVNAAGNEAEDHWAGTYADQDGDRWHNFSGTDEVLSFDTPAYVPVDVLLRWDDWGTWNGSRYSGSNQDYDLFLFILNGSTWIEVDKSEGPQNGGQDPVEGIFGWYSRKPAKWGIAIRKYAATRKVIFDAFISNHLGNIEYNRPAGSLSSPGDSQYSLTVGAVDWSDDSYHTYSSQGPTADGRIKPDLCAPSAVTTVSYGDPFYGTSSACPHVSGALALLKGKMPFSLGEIQKIVESRAIDLGISGKDNVFGLGRLNLLEENFSSRNRRGTRNKTTQFVPIVNKPGKH